jgi:centromeric protein E
LGGSGRTAIICTISEEQEHAEESHNTLEFATQAKRVVNSMSATETITSAALMKRQAKEVNKLKEQLHEKR